MDCQLPAIMDPPEPNAVIPPKVFINIPKEAIITFPDHRASMPDHSPFLHIAARNTWWATIASEVNITHYTIKTHDCFAGIVPRIVITHVLMIAWNEGVHLHIIQGLTYENNPESLFWAQFIEDLALWANAPHFPSAETSTTTSQMPKSRLSQTST